MSDIFEMNEPRYELIYNRLKKYGISRVVNAFFEGAQYGPIILGIPDQVVKGEQMLIQIMLGGQDFAFRGMIWDTSPAYHIMKLFKEDPKLLNSPSGESLRYLLGKSLITMHEQQHDIHDLVDIIS